MFPAASLLVVVTLLLEETPHLVATLLLEETLLLAETLLLEATPQAAATLLLVVTLPAVATLPLAATPHLVVNTTALLASSARLSAVMSMFLAFLALTAKLLTSLSPLPPASNRLVLLRASKLAAVFSPLQARMFYALSPSVVTTLLLEETPHLAATLLAVVTLLLVVTLPAVATLPLAATPHLVVNTTALLASSARLSAVMSMFLAFLALTAKLLTSLSPLPPASNRLVLLRASKLAAVFSPLQARMFYALSPSVVATLLLEETPHLAATLPLVVTLLLVATLPAAATLLLVVTPPPVVTLLLAATLPLASTTAPRDSTARPSAVLLMPLVLLLSIARSLTRLSPALLPSSRPVPPSASRLAAVSSLSLDRMFFAPSLSASEAAALKTALRSQRLKTFM